MTTYENFKFEVDGDGIALVTWDMPNRTMNVLSQSSMADMASIIEKIMGDEAIKGAILTSGKDAFCAGKLPCVVLWSVALPMVKVEPPFGSCGPPPGIL